ncbi:MAG: hypothetical protein ACFBSD_09470 [Paracoccaceae bacterium]
MLAGASRARAVLAITCAGIAVFAAILALQWERFPGGAFEDDAYFYAVIQQRILAGDGVSFDGLRPTNGFHLLWMGWLASVGGVLQVLGAAHAAAFVVAVCLPLVPLLRLPPGTFALALVAAYFCGPGMEGIAAGLLLALLVASLERRGPLALGALSAALILARFDLAPVAIGLALWRRSGGRPGGGAILAGTALGLALSAVGHLWLAGIPVPVSALVKSGWLSVASPATAADLLRSAVTEPGNLVRLAIWATALSALALSAPRGPLGHPIPHVLAALWLLGHAVLHPLRDWYWAVPVMLAVVGSGLARPPQWATPVAVLMVAGGVGAAALHWHRSTPARAELAAVLARIEATVPAGAPILVPDGAGFVAQRLYPRPVVNGDGLVNDVAWARRSLDPDWTAARLREDGVRYLLTPEGLGPRPRPGLACAGRPHGPPAGAHVLWRLDRPIACVRR